MAVGNVSVVLAARTGSGWRELVDITGDVRPAGLVMVMVHGELLTKLAVFCGVLLAKLTPNLSLSSANNSKQTLGHS